MDTNANLEEEYDQLWRHLWANTHSGGPMARTRYRLALRWLKLRSDSRERILDVGAGNGAFMVTLLRRHPAIDVFGAELSDAAIGLAPPQLQARIAKCDLQGDAHLPWGGKFNLITCMEVLEHLPDDYLAMGKIASALEPGGQLLISVPAWKDQWGPQDVAAGHVRRYEPEDMEQLLEKSGLHLLRISCWGGLVARSYLKAADVVGPQRVMSIQLTGFARLAATLVYNLLKIDDVIAAARGPQMLVLAQRS